VAEDDPLSRKLLETLLPMLGVVPEMVIDGAAAVQRVHERSYDLVLMDLWMPVLDGADATRAIRALPLPAAATPIIGITADWHGRPRCLAAGMQDVIQKPVAFEMLRDTVQRWLPQRRRQAI
jgi:CheY-like chemotaxis protein